MNHGVPLPIDPLGYFLFGAICMASFVIGIFFWRYYLKTRDRLLQFFSIAFLLMGAERVMLLLMQAEGEERPEIYIVRLLAFGLIIVGIWEKNRVSARDAGSGGGSAVSRRAHLSAASSSSTSRPRASH